MLIPFSPKEYLEMQKEICPFQHKLGWYLFDFLASKADLFYRFPEPQAPCASIYAEKSLGNETNEKGEKE